MDEYEHTLRSLAVHDEQVIRSLVASGVGSPDALGIDAKTYALVRLSVLIAVGGPVVSYQSAVTLALATGATTGDIVNTLKAVAPIVGWSRIVAAAPALALALGYDIETAFESRDSPGLRG